MAKSDTNKTSGIFNFQDVMNKFYAYKPKEDDPEGNALKTTFQGNMVQSILDTQLAKEMAFANQEIAANAMTQAADLEMRNQAEVMKNEFANGMSKMGAEYDYQSRFAVDEASRQLKQMATEGDINQNQTKLEGKENRLNLETQGRLDVDKIKSQGSVDIANIKEQGGIDRAKITDQGKVDVRNIKEQGTQDKGRISAQGDVDVT